MNVIVTVNTGTHISVTQEGQRNVTVASPSSLTLAQVDTLYYPRSNPSGFATGIDNSTLVLRSETGQFYPRSNPSGFITGLNINTGNFVTTNQTGNFVTNNLTGSFITNNQTGSFITTAMTGGFVDVAHTGSFITTAQTGQFYPTSNPSGYITSAQAGGVQSINISGSIVSGAISFTGIGGLIISRTGQTIVFSGGVGGTGSSVNTGQLTGVFVDLTTNQNISGAKTFIGSVNIDATASMTIAGSTQVTSNILMTNILDHAAQASVDVDNRRLGLVGGATSLDWNARVLSGAWNFGSLTSGGTNISQIFQPRGEFLNYSTGLSSGIEQLVINFPTVLASMPIVTCDFQNDIDNLVYNHVLSSVSISGFTISFSDFLSTTGYKLHIRASI